MEAKQLIDLLNTSNGEVTEIEANLKSVTAWQDRNEAGEVIEVTPDKQRFLVAFEVDVDGKPVRKTAFVFRNAFPEAKIPRFDRTGLPVTVTVGSEPITYSNRAGETVQGIRVIGFAYDISALNRNAIALMANRLDF